MAEQYDAEKYGDESAQRSARRWPDLITLVAGIATLFASAFALSDGASWLPVLDPRWVLAGGATLVGLVLLLGASLGGRKR